MPNAARKSALRRTGPVRTTGRTPRQLRPALHRTIALDGLDNHLGYFIRRVQVWVFQDFNRTLKSLSISPAQYSVLLIIDANPGLSQAELGRTLNIERARLVRVLQRLDRRGLTRRLRSSSDGRTHALQLTPKGRETMRRAMELAEQHEARLVDKFGVEPYRVVKNILRDF
jgi:DNA-binding MarR family transcriptional regulator